MGERIRTFDWSQTPIGPISNWPQSLKTAVRILLNSRYPMFIWWGPELINIYNDAYVPVLGARHPQALGQSAPKIWADVWPVVGPQSEIVLNQGQATWNESVLLMMERYGYSEETYFTFSYSPAPNDDGSVGGVFCVCTEDTQRVVGERQLALLRELAAKTTDVRTWQEACTRSVDALSLNAYDLPFAMIYIAEPDGTSLSLAGASGIVPGHLAAPYTVNLAEQTPWPIAAGFGGYNVVVVEDLHQRIGTPLPTGAWPKPPTLAALIPIAATGQTARGGVLVVGLNPFRFFDDGYRHFLLLVAGQISASIASAQAYEEEKKRAEALAELDRAKTTFFSNVSHEFRTPLTLMLGPVEEMLQKRNAELAPAIRKQLEVVHRNSLRLLKLVNTMLDFSRLEAGRLQASYEPINLAQYTAELASIFRAAIEQAGLKLIVNCALLPKPVYVDRDMWEKIVLNLLSNALKFTLAGEIEIRLEERDGQACLTVRDTGVGIPATELPRVFERFHRVQDTRGRTHEGTGIGLALVQELVKLHGGTVRAESVLNEGSHFIVTVPLGKDHLDPQHINVSSELTPTKTGAELFLQETLRWLPDAGLNDGYVWLQDDRESNDDRPARTDGQAQEQLPRILWADDNADMREYVSRLLSERFTVEAVADGQAALAAARANPPDLVLSDVMMPRLDGFGLLRALRADPQLRQIPIILLSARADEEALLEGMETDADDYLIKPFSARELIARVESHVRMAQVRREATEALRQSETRYRGLSARLKALLEATSRLIETLETRELLSSLLHLSHEIVAADALGIWRMDDQGDWSIVASSGLSDDFIHESISRTVNIEPPTEPVVIQPEELADQSTSLLRYRWQRYQREGIRSLMILPLPIHGKVSGTLVFYCHSPYLFTGVDIEAAQALANIAATALTTAELYETQSRLRQTAEEAAIRESFLANAGAILSESLNYEQTLANVARVAVPQFADWCAVDLLDEQGVLQRLAIEHVNPQKIPLAQELYDKYPPNANARRGIMHVLHTGEPELMREISDELVVNAARNDDHLRLLRQLQLTSYICVPLQAGDQIYGTITFVSAESQQPFEDQDLSTAQEIARRAAQAIENARLYRNLSEGEQRLRLALTAARAGVWELDTASGKTHWSSEFEPLYGYDAATPRTYQQWLSSLHPHDREQFEEDFTRRLDSGETEFQQEFRIIHPQLGLRWILGVGYIERDENGHALRCLGINMDITERKQAEEALRRQAEETQTLLDTLPIGVFFAHDPNAQRITGNRAAYELMRLPMNVNLSKSAPVQERPAHFRVYQNDIEMPVEQLPVQRAARGEQIRNEEIKHIFDDGTVLSFLISAAPLHDSRGQSRGAIASLLDITERKQAEVALRQLNETLEERVGERTQQVRDLARRLTMAEQEERRRISQILHDDLQQLVYAVKMKVDMLYADIQAAKQFELTQDMDEVRTWIDQVVTMTRQLTVDLSPPILENEGLANAIEWLQNQMKELHGIEVTVAAEHDWYIQDEDLRVLLFQIVRELLFNVKKHAGVDRATVILMEEAEYLVIHVIDEGKGFDIEEVAAREEHAVGFGLFSVRERLRLLGGYLEVRSQPGKGSHVKVYAPVPARAVNINRAASDNIDLSKRT